MGAPSVRGASSQVPLSFLLAAAACGSRTGLYASPPIDASPDDAALDGAAPYDGTLPDAPDASPEVDAAFDAPVDSADAADALALAICHCWRAPMIARMAEAEAKVAEQRKKFAAKVRAAT